MISWFDFRLMSVVDVSIKLSAATLAASKNRTECSVLSINPRVRWPNEIQLQKCNRCLEAGADT